GWCCGGWGGGGVFPSPRATRETTAPATSSRARGGKRSTQKKAPRKNRSDDMARKPTSLLDEMLVAWAYTRDGVIAEVKNLPESALDFKPHPAIRSTRELVQHIIESGLLMSGELPRPDGDFQRKPYPALLKEHSPGGVMRYRTKAELIAALKA